MRTAQLEAAYDTAAERYNDARHEIAVAAREASAALTAALRHHEAVRQQYDAMSRASTNHYDDQWFEEYGRYCRLAHFHNYDRAITQRGVRPPKGEAYSNLVRLRAPGGQHDPGRTTLSVCWLGFP